MAERKVWMPPAWEAADIRAIQSLALYAQGAERPWEPGQEPPTPSPADVKRALDWIIYQAAITYDNGFEAEDSNGRIAAFVDGRQFVGQQIIKAMKLSPKVFEKENR